LLRESRPFLGGVPEGRVVSSLLFNVPVPVYPHG
jgi:hypothetical protein